LGKAQAKALGHGGLPISVVPHPFGIRTAEEVKVIARQCAEEVSRMVTGAAR
jgi:hypothetical protein